MADLSCLFLLNVIVIFVSVN